MFNKLSTLKGLVKLQKKKLTLVQLIEQRVSIYCVLVVCILIITKYLGGLQSRSNFTTRATGCRTVYQ